VTRDRSLLERRRDLARWRWERGDWTDEDEALLFGHGRRWKSGDIDADALAPFAAALGGEVDEKGFIVTPELSMRIDPAAPDYFFVYTHVFASLGAAKKHIREALALVAPVTPDATVRREAALRLWHEARPAAGTLAEDYLRSRGITLPVPPTLRFARYLKHAPTGESFPAMIALVTDADDQPVGIHRTYLAHDGRGKAPVAQSKLSLGLISGGAIRLGAPGPAILVGEGIETSMSGTLLDREHRPAWASVSAINMPKVALPPTISAVTFLADNDDKGVSLRETQKAKRRWLAAGRDARVAVAPAGRDFNDVLMKHEQGPG
jgi:hypothetical protein